MRHKFLLALTLFLPLGCNGRREVGDSRVSALTEVIVPGAGGAGVVDPCLNLDDHSDNQSLKFTVTVTPETSPKNSKSFDFFPHFTATLVNQGRQDMLVSTTQHGPVRVKCLQGNHLSILPERLGVLSEEDPAGLQHASLTTLHPRNSVSFAFNGLKPLLLERGKPVSVDHYPTMGRGEYVVVFTYEIVTESADTQAVGAFSGVLTSNKVHFHVK